MVSQADSALRRGQRCASARLLLASDGTGGTIITSLTYTDARLDTSRSPTTSSRRSTTSTCFPVSRLGQELSVYGQRPAIADVRIVLNSNFDIAQAAPTIHARRGTTSSWKAALFGTLHNSAGGLFTFASGRSFIENASSTPPMAGIDVQSGATVVHR